MKNREAINIVDLDRIFSDPRLKDEPVVQTCQKIYESWTNLARIYASIGLLVSGGDLEGASANIRAVRRMIRSTLGNLDVLDREVEAELSAIRENKAREARAAETERWIEEAEREG